MRLLFLGDVVGRTGRRAVIDSLPDLKNRLSADFVIVNGENAAGGYGITRDILQKILGAGADVVTSGNHAFDQKETLEWASDEDKFLRPLNYPSGAPGRGSNIYRLSDDTSVLVINIMGRIFMGSLLDDPFAVIEREISACPLGSGADYIIVDFHAEATSEKQCFGHYVDGRVSAVIGTHTHVPTSDYQILSGGTAYQSDVGMCGDYDSSLGMGKDEAVNRFVTGLSGSRFEPAAGPATICGLVIDFNSDGLASSITPLRLGGLLSETFPPDVVT